MSFHRWVGTWLKVGRRSASGVAGGGRWVEPLESRQLLSAANVPLVGIVGEGLADRVPEGAGEILKFRITRDGGDMSQPLSVRYVIGGDADNGGDYRAIADTITIPANKARARVRIAPIDDDAVEPTESIRLRVATESDRYQIDDSANAARLYIEDDDRHPVSQPGSSLPITIQAEDFDEGGEGVTYHDGNRRNRDGDYRQNTDVDIRAIGGTSDEFVVSRVQPGEWLEYSVRLPATGVYDLEIRLASNSGGGTMHVNFAGNNVTGALNVPSTGGWENFQVLKVKGVSLSAGDQFMRIVADTVNYGGTNLAHLDWIRISPHQPTASLAWSTKASLPLAREEVNSAVVGDKLYIFGGLTGTDFKATARADVYNPSNNSWTRLSDMPEEFTHAGVAVDGTDIWFVGGYFGDHPGPGGRPVWIYHTTTDTWNSGPMLPEARGAGAAAIVDRTIHYFGGMDETRTIDESDHWALDLDNLAAGWVERAKLPNARNHLGAAVVNGKIYAMGGEKDGSHNEGDDPGDEHYRENQDAVQMYDPVTDVWTDVASLPQPASHFHQSTTVWQGHIILVGGEHAHNDAISDVLAYDPVTDTWEHLTSLPAERRALGAGIINGKIIVAGGWDNAQKATVWISSSVAF